MRITKRIEEYIRQQVETKAYHTDAFKALKQADEDARKRYSEGLKEIQQAAQEAYTKMLTDMDLPHAAGYRIAVTGRYEAECDLPAVVAFRNARSKLNSEVRATVEEILVTMEMGGDKNTLNDLLEAVHFE